MNPSDPFASHGGLLIPLDMFRVSHIAAVIGEALVAKARNIIDAQLVLTRHPASQLLLARIEGTVVGDDEAAFWREYVDLSLAVSQVVPRQAFLYYVAPGPGAGRREGFIVAQQGQVLAAEDATVDSVPLDNGVEAWPVARLCEQMGLSIDELAGGFAGGPSVSVSLLEPKIDDQAAIMTLAGQQPDPAADPEAGPPAPPKPNPGVEDARRRAAQQAADAASASQRAAQVAAALPQFEDAVGLVVAPNAEISEVEILAPFVVSSIVGDLPPGLPRERADALQGKRLDVLVKVDFLSEVFVENKPLSRPTFDEGAEQGSIGGQSVKIMEVLAPRIGYGLLIARDRNYVYISRRSGMPLPEALVAQLLGGS